jgi:hypothetical protein
VQKQSAADIYAWHKRVEGYLAKSAVGLTYLARFKNQKRGSGAYPSGINISIAGVWDLLHSDLERLDEFIRER